MNSLDAGAILGVAHAGGALALHRHALGLGVDFDRQYRDMQVSAHTDAIALFEHASTKCEDADVKAFAAKVLPTLREHQQKLSEMPPTAGN